MNELDYIPDQDPQDAPAAAPDDIVPDAPDAAAPVPLEASVRAVERLLRPLAAGIVDDPWQGLGPAGDRPLKNLPPAERERAELSPNFIRTAGLLAVRGFSDQEIAEAFGVGLATVRTWEREYPDFKETLSRCKDIQDAAVERSLYNIATGYSVPDLKITTDKDGIVTRTPYIKHYPPDVRAIQSWLYNRRPDRWRPVAPDVDAAPGGRDAGGVVDNRVQVVVFSPLAGQGSGQQGGGGLGPVQVQAVEAGGGAGESGGTVTVPYGGGSPPQNQ